LPVERRHYWFDSEVSQPQLSLWAAFLPRYAAVAYRILPVDLAADFVLMSNYTGKEVVE
jgi:uncharacterized membrane protein YkvA (DUF1232 family)